MPIFNILEQLLNLDLFRYIFMSFAFYGLNLCIKSIIKGGKIL